MAANIKTYNTDDIPTGEHPRDWPVYRLSRGVHAVSLGDEKFRVKGNDETFDGGYLVWNEDSGEVDGWTREEFERLAVYEG